MFLCLFDIREERKYRYNLLMRHVSVTKIAVCNRKYSILRVCVCSLIYPSCKELATYYIAICGLYGSTIFLHIVSRIARFFEKKLFNVKWMFSFYLQHF